MVKESWIYTADIQTDKLVDLAKISEHIERYEDMIAAMKRYTEAGNKLNSEERNLLSAAYKNVVGVRRNAWRLISGSEAKLTDKKKEIAQKIRMKVEDEVNAISNEALKLLDDYLLSTAVDAESKVFYYKMKGDYHRYRAEVTPPANRAEIVNSSLEAYDAAKKIAENELDPTHPIRLGLALNFSVFYFEIMNDSSSACTLAESAFGAALAELDSLREDTYRESTLILQLLRDNLNLWSTDQAGTEEGEFPDS